MSGVGAAVAVAMLAVVAPLHAQQEPAFSSRLDFRLPDTLHRAELDSMLVRELDAAFVPHLVDRGAGLSADSAYRVLANAVEGIPPAGEAERPLRLLAVDRLAETIATPWLPVGAPVDDVAASRRERLETMGIRLSYSPLGMYWAYRHDLLLRLWETAQDTPWGAHAFLLLQLRGWDTSATCEEGTEAFHPVIARGESFLRERGSSPVAPYVRLTVAQALETWWSLAVMAPDDATRDYVDPDSLRDGAEDARRRAVAHYRTVAERVTDAGLRGYALAKAEALEAGLDTGQRKFVCIYD